MGLRRGECALRVFALHSVVLFGRVGLDKALFSFSFFVLSFSSFFTLFSPLFSPLTAFWSAFGVLLAMVGYTGYGTGYGYRRFVYTVLHTNLQLHSHYSLRHCRAERRFRLVSAVTEKLSRRIAVHSAYEPREEVEYRGN